MSSLKVVNKASSLSDMSVSNLRASSLTVNKDNGGTPVRTVVGYTPNAPLVRLGSYSFLSFPNEEEATIETDSRIISSYC